MKIHVLQAINSPFETFSLALSGDAADWGIAGEYDFAAPIEFTAEYFYNGKTLEMRGRFKTVIKADCSRCLKEFLYPVDQEAEAFFSARPDEEGMEYPMKEGAVSLDQLARDEILASLPMRFLCGRDCKGLCPVCGADMNTAQCGCGQAEGKVNPFERLKDLFD